MVLAASWFSHTAFEVDARQHHLPQQPGVGSAAHHGAQHAPGLAAEQQLQNPFGPTAGAQQAVAGELMARLHQ